MQSLDSRNYVATAADIAAIAKTYGHALSTGQSLRGTYLRALVATTQAELGAKPRQRAGTDEGKTPADVTAAQLKALDSVHERFYAIVLENVSGSPEERNRQSGFARSAVSTVRAYVRAGHDITLLAAARVTKAALAAAAPTARPRLPTGEKLRKRVQRAVTALTTVGDLLAKTSKADAIDALENALTAISAKLLTYGVAKPTKNVKKAVHDRVPFQTAQGMFFPVERPLS